MFPRTFKNVSIIVLIVNIGMSIANSEQRYNISDEQTFYSRTNVDGTTSTYLPLSRTENDTSITLNSILRNVSWHSKLAAEVGAPSDGGRLQSSAPFKHANISFSVSGAATQSLSQATHPRHSTELNEVFTLANILESKRRSAGLPDGGLRQSFDEPHFSAMKVRRKNDASPALLLQRDASNKTSNGMFYRSTRRYRRNYPNLKIVKSIEERTSPVSWHTELHGPLNISLENVHRTSASSPSTINSSSYGSSRKVNLFPPFTFPSNYEYVDRSDQLRNISEDKNVEEERPASGDPCTSLCWKTFDERGLMEVECMSEGLRVTELPLHYCPGVSRL